MFLIDVNLWLALALQSHFHHSAAAAWFDALPDQESCHFCRMTQQGFLRLATNPKAFGNEAVTLSQAWDLYDAFLNDPRVTFAEEPTGVEPLWRTYTVAQTFSPKVWNDAFLAAFARVSAMQLVSFDHGFGQFSELKCTILS